MRIIHALWLKTYWTGSCRLPLKHQGDALLPTSTETFSKLIMFAQKSTVILCLLYLPLWYSWPLKASILFGNILKNRPVSSALKLSFLQYLSSKRPKLSSTQATAASLSMDHKSITTILPSNKVVSILQTLLPASTGNEAVIPHNASEIPCLSLQDHSTYYSRYSLTQTTREPEIYSNKI